MLLYRMVFEMKMVLSVRTVRKSGTHLLLIVAVLDSPMDIKIDLLTALIRRARVTQICTTCLEQLEEPPRGCPDVQVAVILDSRTEVEFAHEGLDIGAWRQRWEQAGSARRGRRRWRDGSCAGELRAHMLFFVKYMDQKSEARAKARNGDVHDVLLYKVQSTRQRAELYANELQVCTRMGADVGRERRK